MFYFYLLKIVDIPDEVVPFMLISFFNGSSFFGGLEDSIFTRVWKEFYHKCSHD